MIVKYLKNNCRIFYLILLSQIKKSIFWGILILTYLIMILIFLLATLSVYFLSQHFLPYIVNPTSVSDQSATIIDNIFSNACNFDTISGNILTQISDHFPEIIIVKKAGITVRSLSYYQHDHATFNPENFVSDFDATSLEHFRCK